MDAALFQAIYILTRKALMSTPLPMPRTIKKVVDGFDPRQFGHMLLTRNVSPIFGHAAGVLVLNGYIVRPLREDKAEVSYSWDVATPVGGVPPERLYATAEHKLLPGFTEE